MTPISTYCCPFVFGSCIRGEWRPLLTSGSEHKTDSHFCGARIYDVKNNSTAHPVAAWRNVLPFPLGKWSWGGSCDDIYRACPQCGDILCCGCGTPPAPRVVQHVPKQVKLIMNVHPPIIAVSTTNVFVVVFSPFFFPS